MFRTEDTGKLPPATRSGQIVDDVLTALVHQQSHLMPLRSPQCFGDSLNFRVPPELCCCHGTAGLKIRAQSRANLGQAKRHGFDICLFSVGMDMVLCHEGKLHKCYFLSFEK